MLQNKIPFCEWRLHNGSTWYWYSSSLELNLTLLPEAPYVQPPFHIQKYTSGSSLSTRSSSLSFVRSLSHSVSFQLSLPYHYSSAGKSCIVDTLQINAKFSNLLLKLNDNRVYSIEQQFSEMFEWIKVTCSIHIYLLFGSSFWTITLARRLELHSNIHLHIYTWHQVLFTLLIWLFAFSQLVQLIFNTDHFIQLRSVYNVQCTVHTLCVPFHHLISKPPKKAYCWAQTITQFVCYVFDQTTHKHKHTHTVKYWNQYDLRNKIVNLYCDVAISNWCGSNWKHFSLLSVSFQISCATRSSSSLSLSAQFNHKWISCNGFNSSSRYSFYRNVDAAAAAATCFFCFCLTIVPFSFVTVIALKFELECLVTGKNAPILAHKFNKIW